MRETVVEQLRFVADNSPVDPVSPPVQSCFVHPRLEKKWRRRSKSQRRHGATCFNQRPHRPDVIQQTDRVDKPPVCRIHSTDQSRAVLSRAHSAAGLACLYIKCSNRNTTVSTGKAAVALFCSRPSFLAQQIRRKSRPSLTVNSPQMG